MDWVLRSVSLASGVFSSKLYYIINTLLLHSLPMRCRCLKREILLILILCWSMMCPWVREQEGRLEEGYRAIEEAR